jgi:hypothetical protein
MPIITIVKYERGILWTEIVAGTMTMISGTITIKTTRRTATMIRGIVTRTIVRTGRMNRIATIVTVKTSVQE